jgi:hypothetical protein
MLDIPNKENVSQATAFLTTGYDAAEFNSVKEALKKAITAYGLTLTPAADPDYLNDDLYQLAKALLVSGGFIIQEDSFSTSNVTFIQIGESTDSLPSLAEMTGKSIRFKIPDTNEGVAGYTITWGSEVKIFKNEDGGDFEAGELIQETLVEATYDGTNWVLYGNSIGSIYCSGEIRTLNSHNIISNGSIFSQNGDIDSGDTMTAFSDITSSHGDIISTEGKVQAGAHITSESGNITCENGNIVASAGNVIASGSLTAQSGGVSADYATINSPDLSYTDEILVVAGNDGDIAKTSISCRANGNIVLPFTYGYTTGSGANIYIDAVGTLWRSTSSRKYKKNERELEMNTENIYNIECKTFEMKNGGATCHGPIAEDIAEVEKDFATFDIKGDPEAIHNNHLLYAVVEEMKKLKIENESLSARILELESK